MNDNLQWLQGIEFSSSVPVQMRGAVEELFFFNKRQAIALMGIRQSIQRFGTPEIVEEEGRLRIAVGGWGMQCLFAQSASLLPNRLVGVVLFLRMEPEVITVTHLAVDPVYTLHSGGSGEGIGTVLIEEVREIARRIKGVQRVELPYRRGCFLSVNGKANGEMQKKEISPRT